MAHHQTFPRHALVIGGGSDIARALIMQLGEHHLHSVVLMGPRLDSLAVAQQQLVAAHPHLTVTTAPLDLADLARVDVSIQQAFVALPELDTVIMAAGLLGDQTHDEHEPSRVQHLISVNFTGAAMALTRCAEHLERQRHGLIIVLSSVAAERVRRSNYLYGSAKAGLDGFSLGLAERLRPNVRVLVVRPGFAITAMTRHLRVPPLATQPDHIAGDVIRAITTSNATIVWSPPLMRPILALYRHLPRQLARRLPY